MKVRLQDFYDTDNDATVDVGEVAATLRGWYPKATKEYGRDADRLQAALVRGEAERLATLADECAVTATVVVVAGEGE